MYVVMYVAGFVSAIIFLLLCAAIHKHRRVKGQKQTQEKSVSKKVKIDTYVKAATSAVLIHGLLMITVSYVLAWFDKDSVSDVSMTLITEIVAPLCLYMGTNCIMNIFEKNELTFSKPIQMQKVQEIWDKVHGDMEDETGDNAAG